MRQSGTRVSQRRLEKGKEAAVEQDAQKQPKSQLPLFEWDRDILHPNEAWEAAARVAYAMRIGIAYAESRFVTPNVAYDLQEWR